MDRVPVKDQERRRRRSGEEIRRLMLEAARECFAEEGYSGATTKEIARRADVAEALLFRAFESKEKLYEVAVLQPFDDFLAAYTERWMDADAPLGTPEEVLRQFVEELYDLVVEHETLFRAMAAGGFARAGDAFDGLERMGEAVKRTHGGRFDPAIAPRVAAVAVIGTAHFRESLFGPKAERQRIVDELVRMLVAAATG